MDEKKESNLKSGAGRWQEKVKNARKETVTETKTGTGTGLRIVAIVLWLLAFALELTSAVLFSKPSEGGFYPIGYAVSALVLDLGILIIGSVLWKKANRKNPATKTDKNFWFNNQFNRIMSSLSFAPFFILVVFNPSTDRKGKWLSLLAGIISFALFFVLLLL